MNEHQQDPASSSDPAATSPTLPWGSMEHAEELAQILDEYVADLKAGKAIDRAKLLAEHPDLAVPLEQCLAGLEFIHRVSKPSESPQQLGDFRIAREIGRGGMGVVYEAEQLSLHRRVALKVLRFGAVADEKALERFRREAETVAHLHHTNIVPIFAVGSENGVYYYAMQFIEGGSLADVVATARVEDVQPEKRRAVSEIARWGLEAAEALAHAHQRGVIHRDIKPSNLLLDTDGRVWLTDFGLARRMDEVTLTMTGMLMGTPRYMSPEQATATKQPVDHRTDIYSLGATLYELLTGRPVFASDTPHGVITQILTTEPVRPRVVRQSIPRDLETIILTCLAKDPTQRYATAQALADDLRAIREGRPIRARRENIFQQATRWVQKQKKSVITGATAAAAALIAAAVGYSIMSSYAAARLAHVNIATLGPHLKIELLDEEEKITVAMFTAPTQEPQDVPPGKYHMRLSAEGRLSETSLFEASQGNYYWLTAALGERDLWDIPVQEAETEELARLDGRDEIIITANDSVRRMNSATGQQIWKTTLTTEKQPLLETALGKDYRQVFRPRGYGTEFTPQGIVRPLVDLDGDGTPDLIVASRMSTALVALSGKTGDVLWCHYSRVTPPDGVDVQNVKHHSLSNMAMVVGQPLFAEVDGKSIVVATYAADEEGFVMPDNKGQNSKPQLWLEAVAAKSGEFLWRHDLTRTGDEIDKMLHVAAIGKLAGHTICAFAWSNRLVGCDLLTGDPVWPEREFDKVPPLTARFADLTGQGQTDLLFVRDVVTHLTPDEQHELLAKTNAPSVSNEMHELFLVAVSALSKIPIWERSLKDVSWRLYGNGGKRIDYDWPLVATLEPNGKPAVIIPFVDHEERTCGVEIVEGTDGTTRWQRHLSSMSPHQNPSQVDRIEVGPDLDGDGHHELFTASFEPWGQRIFVDALSGRDGRSLWNTSHPIHTALNGGLSPLRWWQVGTDGQPMLIASGDVGQGLRSLVMSASTGKIEHILNNFGEPQIADLNGDGLPDLMARRSNYPSFDFRFIQGKLHAIRGVPPPAWRMIGYDDLSTVNDFNGDGIKDLMYSHGTAAVSGRDGTLLWQGNRKDGVTTGPLPDSDFDGDGTPDVLFVSQTNTALSAKVSAASGRDGQLIWTTTLKFEGNESFDLSNNIVPHLAGHLLDGSGQPDVLLLYSRNRWSENGGGVQTWLVRLSGRDGKIVWQQPLNEYGGVSVRDTHIPIATADLDGDGVKDLVFWIPLSKAEAQTAVPVAKTDVSPDQPQPSLPMLELRAYSGRDGKLLWRHPAFVTNYQMNQLDHFGGVPLPVITDLNGQGKHSVLVTDAAFRRNSSNQQAMYAEVLALDGRDGKLQWSWRGDDGHDMETRSNWVHGSPQVLRTADGPQIAVSVYDRKLEFAFDPKTQIETKTGKSSNQIVILSPKGEVLHRTDIKSLLPNGDREMLHVTDLNGDGKDGLVWRDVGTIRAMYPGSEQFLWEYKLPVREGWGYFGNVRDILSSSKNQPSTVSVETVEGVVGLNGLTGKPRWHCDVFDPIHAGILSVNDATGMPQISESGPGSLRTSRWALPSDESGKSLAMTATTRTYDEPPFDSRLQRPLPWGTHEDSPYSFGNPPSLGMGWLERLVCMVLITFAIGKRPGRLRRIRWLFTLWVVVTVGMTIAWLLIDSRQSGSGQYYVWAGWYRIFAYSFAGTMWLLFVGLAGLRLFQLARWIVRKLLKQSV